MGDRYFWRQVFILTTTIFSSLSSGIMTAFPSVLNLALLSPNNTDIEATKDQVSWITTSKGIASIFGFFLLPPILQIFGRKAFHIADALTVNIGCIIFALANNVTALVTARIFHGFHVGSTYIQLMIISEYSSPKRRGYFTIFKKGAIAVGILICHALALVWDWRQIATYTIIFPTLAIVFTLFWPESPSYLAMKNRFEESKKSYIWLHGDLNLQELHSLHLSQLQKPKNQRTEKWYKSLFKKDFLRPFVIVSLLTMIIELSGKHYFAIFVIQMMMTLVGDKSLAVFCTIGTDLLSIVAFLCSYFIIRQIKRRTILFSFGALTVVLMLIICFIVISKSPIVVWLAPALIFLHTFIVYISVIPVCFVLCGEIIPLEHKGWSSCLNGIVITVLYTLLLKFTPVLIESTSVGGVYAIYGIIIAGCLIVLYGILPETKDRTLQEIEDELKGIDLLNCEEITSISKK